MIYHRLWPIKICTCTRIPSLVLELDVWHVAKGIFVLIQRLITTEDSSSISSHFWLCLIKIFVCISCEKQILGSTLVLSLKISTALRAELSDGLFVITNSKIDLFRWINSQRSLWLINKLTHPLRSLISLSCITQLVLLLLHEIF